LGMIILLNYTQMMILSENKSLSRFKMSQNNREQPPNVEDVIEPTCVDCGVVIKEEQESFCDSCYDKVKEDENE